MNDAAQARFPLEYRVIALQAALVAMVATVAALAAGTGLAVLAGGGCALIPNALMALRARRSHRAGMELASAAGLFIAMLTKLGLTVLLLALALRNLGQHSAGGFFTGFIVALLAHHAAFLMKDASHEGVPPAPPEPDVEDDRGGGDTGPGVRRRDETDSKSDRG